jgi:hypothetical protein
MGLSLAVVGLTGCDEGPQGPDSPDREGPAAAGKADGAQTGSIIEFDRSFSTPVATPNLVPGGTVDIDYDMDRFYDVYDGAASYGWFASSFHCYGYGCCEVTIPEVDAHYRFDGGEVTTVEVADGEASIDLPSDAESLEMWFSAPGFEIRTWYCGCSQECADENYEAATPHFVEREAWDSAYGNNYAFPVSADGFEVVHGQDVKLISAETTNYGCSSCGAFRGEIEVRNIAYAKSVEVFYTVIGGGSTDDGQWHSLPAEYLGPAAGGAFERWQFETTGAPFIFGETRFAIRYEVDGRTLWDNNCGWDYQLVNLASAEGQSCG